VRGAVARDLEDDIRGRLGLDLKEGALEGVVLLQEVRRGFSKILGGGKGQKRARRTAGDGPSRMGARAGGGTW
jgi:hypothetical protein